MKKKILKLRVGKRRLHANSYDTFEAMKGKLTDKQYILYWRVDAQECVYIDSKNILTGQMSEKVFDTIDKTTIYGTV